MKRFRRFLSIPLFAALVLSAAQMAVASTGPKWSPEQLTDFSAAVVSGRVSAIATAVDSSGGIYTYVSIDVSDVLKGDVPNGRVVLKQAGGIVGDLALDVSGQATFSVGQEVLVFAVVRPRDRTLYTTGLWQGKWAIEQDADGARVAVQRDDSIRNGSTEMARVELGALRAAIVARASRDAAQEIFYTVPDETPEGSQLPFVYNSTKWRIAPAPFDIQSGGQPGLPDGGLAALANSAAQWNAASNFKWQARSNAGTLRCGNTQPPSRLQSYDLMIVFNDPCDELDDFSGGPIAAAFTFSTTASEETFNGVAFRRIIQTTIVTNDYPTAQQYVTNPNCFLQVMLHEMGHSLGIGHTTDLTAVMAATVSFNQCSVAPRSLQPDDIAAARFIYNQASGTGAPGPPTVTSASGSGGVLQLQWTSGTGGPPSTHRLEFLSGGAVVATLTVGGGTTFSTTLPAGTQGTFGVRVTAINPFGQSPASAPFTFTIGDQPPGQPTITSATASGGLLTITWTGSGPTPTAHRLEFFQGGTPLATVPVGAATSVGLPVPAGLQGAFSVRVTALSGTAASAPSPLFNFTIGTACTPPTAPAVTGSIVNGTATISWPPVAGATNYILSAGTTQGGAQILGPTNFGASTGASAPGLPAGFQAWIRVIAVNACGQQGAPTDFLLQ
jgi:Matrixin